MKNYIILVILSLGIISACKPKTLVNTDGDLPEIVFDSDKAGDIVDVSEIIDSSFFRIIPLETTEASLISNIYKLFYKNNRFYILDAAPMQLFQNILIFDDNGKFIKKISGNGRGPNEYLRLLNMTVTDNSIIAYDTDTYRLLYYDLDGNFLKYYKSEFNNETILYCSDFFSLDDGNIYINHGSSTGPEGRFMLYKTDTGGKIVNSYAPMDSERYGFGGNHDHSVCGDAAYMIYSTVDTIFRVTTNEGMTPAYRIKELRNKMPDKFKYGYKKGTQEDMMADYSEVVSKGYSLGLRGIIATPNDLLLKIGNYSVRYRKSDGYIVAGEQLWIEPFSIGISLSRMTAQGGFLIDSNSAYNFLSDREYYEEDEYSNLEYKNRIMELLSTVNEMDNPIIFMYKFQ